MRAVELHTEDTEDDIKSDYDKKHMMTHMLSLFDVRYLLIINKALSRATTFHYSCFLQLLSAVALSLKFRATASISITLC